MVGMPSVSFNDAALSRALSKVARPGKDFIVKNTFICVVEDDASPAGSPCHHAFTDSVALAGVTAEAGGQDNTDDDIHHTGVAPPAQQHDVRDVEPTGRRCDGRRAVVRNTFICLLDDDGSDGSEGRRRAQTDGAASSPRRAEATVELAPLATKRCGRDAFAQELLAAMRAGGDAAAAAVEAVCGAAASLSFDTLGCQAVLTALGQMPPWQVRQLLASFDSMALAARSSRASVALLEALRVAPVEAAAAIAAGLLGETGAVCLHVTGCEVVCDMIEACASEPHVAALLDEVVSRDLGPLICHKFGHHVAVLVLRHGSKLQRSAVVAALRGNLPRFARHRFAALVLEQALKSAALQEAEDLAQELMRAAGAVASLACHCFGLQVVRTLMDLPSAGERARQFLFKSQRRLQKDRFGMQLLGELGLDDAERCQQSAFVGGA